MAVGNRTEPGCEENHAGGHAVARWPSTDLVRSCYRLCDRLTGGLLCFMVTFGPWAFGTTEPWSIRVMNIGGYALGGILLFKWALRWGTGYRPPRWGESTEVDSNLASTEIQTGATSGGSSNQSPAFRSWLVKGLGLLTFFILLYCLVSAINARSALTADYLQLVYRKCVVWLPHSYDATLTWDTFAKYLGLAAVFWAARDWLIAKTRFDRARLKEEGGALAMEKGCFVPRRLQILLWFVCLNGAALAAEGLLQRALGGGKLLFLVEPHINKSPEAQFGPYAYRSNAAQLLLLAWPLAVGFWWVLRRRGRFFSTGLKVHNNLLPCILVMALVPLMSLSRAGAIIGLLTILAGLGLVLTHKGRHQKMIWGVVGLLAAALLLGTYMEWRQLDSRFRQEALNSPRFETWRTAWQIVQDFPVYGTGPGTFSSVYQLYRRSVNDEWYAFAHNDWLETLLSFGAVGSVLVLLALGAVLVLPFVGKGIQLHRIFSAFIYVALGSCLLYAFVDFPFQVHSVLFLFVIECAILSCRSLGH